MPLMHAWQTAVCDRQQTVGQTLGVGFNAQYSSVVTPLTHALHSIVNDRQHVVVGAVLVVCVVLDEPLDEPPARSDDDELPAVVLPRGVVVCVVSVVVVEEPAMLRHHTFVGNCRQNSPPVSPAAHASHRRACSVQHKAESVVGVGVDVDVDAGADVPVVPPVLPVDALPPLDGDGDDALPVVLPVLPVVVPVVPVVGTSLHTVSVVAVQGVLTPAAQVESAVQVPQGSLPLSEKPYTPPPGVLL